MVDAHYDVRRCRCTPSCAARPESRTPWQAPRSWAVVASAGSTTFIWTSTSWPSATPGSSSSSMVLPWTLPCIVLVMIPPPVRRLLSLYAAASSAWPLLRSHGGRRSDKLSSASICYSPVRFARFKPPFYKPPGLVRRDRQDCNTRPSKLTAQSTPVGTDTTAQDSCRNAARPAQDCTIVRLWAFPVRLGKVRTALVSIRMHRSELSKHPE